MKLIPDLIDCPEDRLRQRVKVQQPARFLSNKSALISSLLLFGICLGTTDAAFAESTSVANPATKAPLSPKELSDLIKAKRVSDWRLPGGTDQGPVVNLSPWECTELGGTVSSHDSCGTTKLKCTIGKRAACITESD